MKQLREEIETLLNRSKCSKEEISLITQEKELYPFSCESRILVYLMSLGKITYDEYVRLDRDYCATGTIAVEISILNCSIWHLVRMVKPGEKNISESCFRNSLKPQKKISLMYILLLMANLISG